MSMTSEPHAAGQSLPHAYDGNVLFVMVVRLISNVLLGRADVPAPNMSVHWRRKLIVKEDENRSVGPPRPTAHHRLTLRLNKMASKPTHPARLASALDAHCGVYLDFALHGYDQDLPRRRRDLHALLLRVRTMLGDPASDLVEDSTAAQPGGRDLAFEHDLVVTQLVSDDVKKPEDRQRHADQLMTALYTIADFPLVPSLKGYAGRPEGDVEAMAIAEAVRVYLKDYEGQHFGEKRYAGKETILWNQRAINMVTDVLALLGVRSRLTVNEIVRRTHDKRNSESMIPVQPLGGSENSLKTTEV